MVKPRMNTEKVRLGKARKVKAKQVRKKVPDALATYRAGEEEMRRANAILERELPDSMKSRLIPVPSPGRASLVNVLYEDFGKHGVELDYTEYDSRWELLAEGSSSYAGDGDGMLIHADGKSSRVHLGNFLSKLYRRWHEQPGTQDGPHDPCVMIDKKTETVRYFEAPVKLEHQQFEILTFLIEETKRTDASITDGRIIGHLALPDGANLEPIVSRIRSKFRKAARSLPMDLRKTALNLIKVALLPRKNSMVGYRVGRTELFAFFG